MCDSFSSHSESETNWHLNSVLFFAQDFLHQGSAPLLTEFIKHSFIPKRESAWEVGNAVVQDPREKTSSFVGNNSVTVWEWYSVHASLPFFLTHFFSILLYLLKEILLSLKNFPQFSINSHFWQPYMVAHAYNPRTQEAEARGSVGVWSQPGLRSKTLSQKPKTNLRNHHTGISANLIGTDRRREPHNEDKRVLNNKIETYSSHILLTEGLRFMQFFITASTGPPQSSCRSKCKSVVFPKPPFSS